jgi:hypothetical protein
MTTEVFDPAVPGRMAELLEDPATRIPIGTMFRVCENLIPFGEDRQADLAQLLERDAYAEKTRLQLAEACATLRAQRDELQQKIDAVIALEVHGGEFVDATDLYRALDLPKPGGRGIDHAASLRAKASGAALGLCRHCNRNVPREHIDVLASHCLEGTASECPGTGTEPVSISAALALDLKAWQ